MSEPMGMPGAPAFPLPETNPNADHQDLTFD